MAPTHKRKKVTMSDETQVLQHDEDAVEETRELDESDAANVAELELDAVDQLEQAPTSDLTDEQV